MTAHHVIADIHYSAAGPSWSQCTCGRRFEAATPDALGKVWMAHRAAVLGSRSRKAVRS